jgi:hypothetical protein
MSRMYRNRKQEFDDTVYGCLVKRLAMPVTDTDAYHTGHVDEMGNELKKPDDWSYTRLDRMIFDLKAILGDRIDNLGKTPYADVDMLALMSGKVDTKDYAGRYMPILAVVEEAAYIPAALRGKAGEADDTSDLPLGDRISFALSVANFLLYAARLERFPNEAEIDEEVLPSVESTFGIRALGSLQEFVDYARNARISDGRGMNRDGYVLLVRIARKVAQAGILKPRGFGELNQAEQWRKVANA